MTVFLRKHFWIVNLLTITLCALFAARAVGQYLESRFTPPPPRRSGVMDSPRSSTESEVQGSRDITSILSRNIFCSTCEKVGETPLKGGDADSQATSDEPVKTSLNLKLLATLVSEDREWSFAAIFDPTEGKTRLCPIGSHVQGETILTDVLEERVYLQTGQRNEFLDLDAEPSPTGAVATASEPVVSVRPTGLSGMEEEVAKSIRKVGEGRYELERSALNKVLANTTLLARSARIVPSMRDGQPNGFKLYSIRPGSLYSLLGLANGDTLNAVNGHSITTPDKALEIYTKLRNASHLTISFSRQSKTVTHEYNIR